MPVLQFRFGHKFGKLSAGAKRGDSTKVYRGCAAVSREISARHCVERLIPGRFVVWTLQRAERRVVGERAIQFRVVRPILRTLPILASVAGPTADRNPKSEIRCNGCEATARLSNPKEPNDRRIGRDCGAAITAAASPL